MRVYITTKPQGIFKIDTLVVVVVEVSPEVERLVVDHERRISPGDLPQAHR